MGGVAATGVGERTSAVGAGADIGADDDGVSADAIVGATASTIARTTTGASNRRSEVPAERVGHVVAAGRAIAMLMHRIVRLGRVSPHRATPQLTPQSGDPDGRD